MGLKPTARSELQREFAEVGTERAGEFYVPTPVASRFIDACVLHCLAIAGIEVFRVEGEKLRPDLNQIADFSSMFSDEKLWDSVVRETAAEARRFIAQVALEVDVRMSFTLLSKDEQGSV